MNSGNGEPITSRTSPFESIRRQAEDGSEYWSARELGKVLGYTEYGKFQNAIQKAETACKNSGQAISDHFAHVSDMIATAKGAKRRVEDVHLSRYACYLLVENADSSKPISAKPLKELALLSPKTCQLLRRVFSSYSAKSRNNLSRVSSLRYLVSRQKSRMSISRQPDDCAPTNATFEQGGGHLGQLVQCHFAAHASESGWLEVTCHALP